MKFLIWTENIIFDPFLIKILFFSIHFNPTDRPWFIIEFARKPKDQIGVALRWKIFLGRLTDASIAIWQFNIEKNEA